MGVAEHIREIKQGLPEGVTLVAVSKFHPAEMIAEAYAAGQTCFGESRVQELAQKVPALPAEIRWHFIGHLQTNKVRQLLRLRPAMIESIDTERLLRAVDAEAERQGLTARVLMQLHVAAEETKFGFSPDELMDFFRGRGYESLRATHICGVMGMASNIRSTTSAFSTAPTSSPPTATSLNGTAALPSPKSTARPSKSPSATLSNPSHS